MARRKRKRNPKKSAAKRGTVPARGQTARDQEPRDGGSAHVADADPQSSDPGDLKNDTAAEAVTVEAALPAFNAKDGDNDATVAAVPPATDAAHADETPGQQAARSDAIDDDAPAAIETPLDDAQALAAQRQEIEQYAERLTQYAEQLEQRQREVEHQAQDLATRRRELARKLREQRKQQPIAERLSSTAAYFDETLATLRNLVAAAQGGEGASTDPVPAPATAAPVAVEAELREQVLQQQAVIDRLERELSVERQALVDYREQADRQLCERLFENTDAPPEDSIALIDQLRNEIAELQAQNEDLASQIATHNVESSIRSNDATELNESMSWEERKQMILQRLEDEESELRIAGGPQAVSDQREIDRLRQLVEQTDHEIARRDQEIAELRELLEQQSGTVSGMAVGAAAIAGLLDQDDLVREEREKLQQIQDEWEQKLRQAEIEVSLERARLARERQEIEKRNLEIEEQLAQQSEITAEGENPAAPKRRWLAKLGLDGN